MPSPSRRAMVRGGLHGPSAPLVPNRPPGVPSVLFCLIRYRRDWATAVYTHGGLAMLVNQCIYTFADRTLLLIWPRVQRDCRTVSRAARSHARSLRRSVASEGSGQGA
jgi:hypothetical protein